MVGRRATRPRSPAPVAAALLWAIVAWGPAPPVDAASIRYLYDEANRLVGVVDDAGDTAVFTYDPAGNLLSIARYASSTVSIVAVAPNTGGPGLAVAISGTGFSEVASQNAVTFNGAAATVSSATPTQLVAVVPAGASTGPIRVTAPAGTAVSRQPFTVAASAGPPAIAGFSPDIGPPGTPVTITGSNFEPDGAANLPSFAGTRATVEQATAASIATRVPAGATTGPIAVTTPAGRAVSADVFVTADVAKPIAVDGAPLAVALERPRQTARLGFEGAPGQRVSVGVVDVTNPGSDVSVARVEGGVIGASQFVGVGGKVVDVPPLPAAGRYMVVIDPRDNNAGSMTVYLSGELTDTLAIGDSRTISIARPGQNARLSFAGGAGQQVSLQVNAGAIPSDVSMVDPGGTALIGPTFVGPNEGVVEQTILPTAGTYAVVINPRNVNVGNVTLALVDVADVTGAIEIGSSATVALARAGQKARLLFDAAAGQPISVQIAPGAVGSDVSLLGPDGAVVAPATFAGSGGGFIDRQKLPVAGTYTILVDPRSTNTGSMTLTLFDVTDVTGTILVGGPSVPVSLNKPGQNARLTFQGTADAAVSVQILSGTVGTGTLSLLAPDGTVLASKTANLENVGLPSQVLAIAGTYTVALDPGGTRTGILTVRVTSP